MSSQMKRTAKESILNDCVSASRKGKREAFMREGNKIMQFSGRHVGPDNPDYDKDEFWAAKITKTSEARQLFGNAIYQRNPTVSYEMKGASPAAELEAEATAKYLTTAMKETAADVQRKRAVDQAVTWGRGCVHTVLDRQGRVTSRWYPVKDHFEDPDAICAEDVRWKGRRRYSQRSELMRQFPDAKDRISKLSSVGKADPSTNSNKTTGDERYFHHDPCDSIEWMVCYFRVGLHNFKSALQKDKFQDNDDQECPEEKDLDNGAKRYVLALNGDRYTLIDEGDWEIPFWQYGHWPMSVLDLLDDDEGDWPTSPLLPGIPWESAINELTQKALAKSQFNLRDIIIIMQNHNVKFTDDDMNRIIAGNDVEVITPEGTSQDASVKDAIEHFQFNQISPEFERLIQLCEHYFEKATGLNEIMYSGTGGAQFRNAAAANLAATASTSRIDQFRDRTDAWAGELADKESFAARVLLDQDDIAKVTGPGPAQNWRQLAPPLELHRNMILEEMPMLAEDSAMLEQVLMGLRQNTVTLDEWAYEWNMSIIPGSTLRPSVQKQQTVAAALMNQPFAAAMGAQNLPLAMSMLAYSLKVNDADPEIIQQMELAVQQTMQMQQQQIMQMQQPPMQGASPLQ